jgi:peptidyl-prolyl cis-trans isomerase A (cyclophilin A)
LLLSALVLTACPDKKEAAPTGNAPAPAAAAPAAPRPGPTMAKALEGQDLYAVFRTSMGDITVRFFAKDAPKTVANFVGLATGEKQWRDPRDGQQKTGTPLYDGTIFHRVIEGFMVQGGDPLGRGNGDPGYRFEDEFQSGRKFDKVGLLAMANAGPNTNGSQFFITTSMPTWLSGKHTIFGEVISGYDIVEAISKVPRGPMDKPNADVVLKKVEVLDKAP